jgi:hypothetical protein
MIHDADGELDPVEVITAPRPQWAVTVGPVVEATGACRCREPIRLASAEDEHPVEALCCRVPTARLQTAFTSANRRANVVVPSGIAGRPGRPRG